MKHDYAQNQRRLRPIGYAIAMLAMTGLMAYGCQKSEKAPPVARPDSTPTSTPAPKPAPKPDPVASTPAAAGNASTPAPADADKPKPIPHESLAKDAKPLNTFQTPTNVTVEEHRAGTGFPTLPKAVVTIHFELRVQSDWSLVQSTYQDGAPETRKLEALVLGLGDGLIGMRKGAMRRIIIPPNRGFGSEGAVDKDGKVVIPPNATLVFDVELVEIQQTLTDMKPQLEVPKAAKAPMPNGEPGK